MCYYQVIIYSIVYNCIARSGTSFSDWKQSSQSCQPATYRWTTSKESGRLSTGPRADGIQPNGDPCCIRHYDRRDSFHSKLLRTGMITIFARYRALASKPSPTGVWNTAKSTITIGQRQCKKKIETKKRHKLIKTFRLSLQPCRTKRGG